MKTLMRILWYGIQGFRRNIWLSVIAIITMTLTITTITIFTLGNVVAANKYQEFNNKIDYSIFLQDTASEVDIEQMKQQIAARPEVKSSEYFTKAQIQARFEKDSKNLDSLKGLITSDNNPLPREIDIRFKDPQLIAGFNQFVHQKRYEQLVETTTYQNNKPEIDTYVRLTNFFKVFGLSFTGFFLLIALLVILNTIRLTIYARREEIEVMRLVGATRGYTRGPFLMEGVLFGLLGALISAVLAWTFLYQLQLLLASSSADQSSNPLTDLFSSTLGEITTGNKFNVLFGELFLLQLLIGLGLGVICSFIAVRRYLKE